MQLASQSEHPWRFATDGTRRRRNSQVLLIGFDESIAQIVSGYLAAMDFEVHICAEPFDGLSALIEDPCVWMSCIVDARAFANDGAFQRYLQLFAFEGEAIGMILGNADAETVERHRSEPSKTIDWAVRNIADPCQFQDALAAVMARRGYGRVAQDPQEKPSLDDRRRLRKGRQKTSKALSDRLKSVSRSRSPLCGRRHSRLPQPA